MNADRHDDVEKRGNDRLTFKDLLVWAGVPLLIVLFLRLFVIGVYEIPSGSMLNTLQIGDRVVASRLTPKFSEIHRGDIVVFKDPANWLGTDEGGSGRTQYLIKRVIGLPGDTVECTGPGSPVTINGKAIDDSVFIREGVNPSDYPFSVTVSEGHLFVMGDNRANSADSRVHQNDGDNGLVPVSDVQAVALAVYWPISHWSGLSRPDGVFDQVGGIAGVGQ
ncbi:signal peptidase [Bifidobacterium margollesii]|uniref:Signal peptidase I n=1 Tax=Bifidobacterium margollesii TaxID=2020964 RepID=A0A2N5JCE3_9BIFI|nr:signal peptidase I [Bifidobacterium margollesii]PLS31878.1 signal peptidase [Bifidobacterium margollesii]